LLLDGQPATRVGRPGKELAQAPMTPLRKPRNVFDPNDQSPLPTHRARALVSVVIPTLGEERNIERVLLQLGLAAQQRPDRSVHYYVADGGSTDGTCAIVERLQKTHANLSLIHNARKLQGPGINEAVNAEVLPSRYLIRCDAHAEYPPDYVDRLIDALERTGADSVVVPMDSTGTGNFQKAVAWLSDGVVGSGGSSHRGGRFSGWIDHGHHAAFRTDRFRELGGYDEYFHPNEDAEFDARLKRAGGRIYMDAHIRIGYHPRSTLKGLWRQYFAYGKARALTWRRHPESLRLRQVAVPAHLALLTLSLLSTPFTWAGWIWPVSYGAILLANGIFLAFEHRSWVGLISIPAAACMHTAWALGFFRNLFAGARSDSTDAPVRASRR
jgi:succinoglycan biosynthesis protein ExoA